MIKENVKPIFYALADALEMDLTADLFAIKGERKTVYEVFESYSPTVVAKITESLVDAQNEVLAVIVQVWGNLQVLVITEAQTQRISLFVLDRSKIDGGKPFGNFWSRKQTYAWLETSCQAVYSRYIFDDEWIPLPGAKQRLIEYNKARKNNEKSGYAHNTFWKEDE